MRDGAWRWWHDGRVAILAEDADVAALDALPWTPIDELPADLARIVRSGLGEAPTVAFEGPSTVTGAPAPGALTTWAEPEPTERVTVPPPVERYQVLGPLGEGGLGRVDRVFDRVLRREAAMKSPKVARAARRFRLEAQATAQLAHPGIVPLYDYGVLPDGRPYFTMPEIVGETFATRLARADRAALAGNVRVLARACDAVAYAHERGVLHRDLKPSNLMIGPFGQVLVLDWGLVRIDPDDADVSTDAEVGRTRVGAVSGTYGYMSPQQAAGQPVDAQTDVYALGAILYELLHGRAPDPEPRFEPPAWAPDSLARLCREAMAPSPADRPAGALAFGRRLEAWLDGVEAEADARRHVDEADRYAALAAAARDEAARCRREAAAALAAVDPFADEAEKAAGWDLEQRADGRDADAQVALAEEQRALFAALLRVPAHPEANGRLAVRQREEADRAEAAGDVATARQAEARVRTHHAHAPDVLRADLARWLDGGGRLTLITDRTAQVTAARLIDVRGRRVPEPAQPLGTTPLVELPLARGSWLLTITPPDGPPVSYPVRIDRCGAWDGTPPGETSPRPIRLPRHGELDPDDVFVPDGWFLAGGDPAVPAFPRQPVWVDGFVIRRFPVTIAELCAFLDDLAPDAVAAHLPRLADGSPLLVRDDAGWTSTDPDWGRPRQPAGGVTWATARAFATWTAAREGRPWDLPGELAWEKAARGVDGRPYPWGDRLDPSFCLALRPGPRRVDDVDAWPVDASVYGVRGLAGNTRDWCLDPYRREGPRVVDGRAVVDPDAPAIGDAREARGGHVSEPLSGARVTARGGGLMGQHRPYLGLRLARPWP